MIINEQQKAHIDAILEKEGIYHCLLTDYDPETHTEADCTSVYINGDIAFDTLAEIVDYLRSTQ